MIDLLGGATAWVFDRWRMLPLHFGLGTLALGLLLIGVPHEWFSEVRYATLRQQIGITDPLGAAVTVIALVMLVPSEVGNARYRDVMTLWQDMAVLLAAGATFVMLALLGYQQFRFGMTPSSLIFAPWPLYAIAFTLTGIYRQHRTRFADKIVKSLLEEAPAGDRDG